MVEGRTEARVLSLTNVQDYGPRDGSVWSDGFDERIMSERLRLQHLESSRGEEAARTWAAGTAKLYLAITRDPHHYASHAECSLDFNTAFEIWSNLCDRHAFPQ